MYFKIVICQATVLFYCFSFAVRFVNFILFIQVKAVIWNISPNVRRDALLTGQARLINLFKKRDIWDNVIIVAKQSLNPESDCQVSDIWDNVIIVATQSLNPESDCQVSDIWDNVIIVAKQSLNPESDCQVSMDGT